MKHLLLGLLFLTSAAVRADVIVIPFHVELSFADSYPDFAGKTVFMRSAAKFMKARVPASGKLLTEAKFVDPCRSTNLSEKELYALTEKINGKYLHVFVFDQKMKLSIEHPWALFREGKRTAGDTIRLEVTSESIVGTFPPEMNDSILSYVRKKARLKHITEAECHARFDCNESLAYLVASTEFRGLRIEEIQEFTGVNLYVKELPPDPGEYIATLRQRGAWKKYKIRVDDQGVIVYFKRR